ncbi:hypothetical protein GTG28_01770 [Vibrio sp. OCN044]|uniref:Uncharacterized protein n=1 Tax=Vibrio tetraodonis subsp. pristinus TaxID=2695891 RepID=A0A6L8LTJ8_9VIBR|nr:hypothetical protein [Vibrio tetraodonis]MYM57940.1 hypothetical protein [Vibrio tetraodonis subsp. pristinus]
MKRKNSHGFLFRYQYPQKLVKWRQEFAKITSIKPEDDPLEPFMEVTDDVLAVRSARDNLRLPFLVPLVIALWFLVYTFSSDLGPSSLAHAREVLSSYQVKESMGYEFNEFHSNRYSYYKTMLDTNGNYTLWSYSQAVFSYGTETQQKFLIKDFVVSGVSLCLAIFFSIFFINTPRPADIYFDRKRGIVYTWFFGRVAACRFENLGFLEHRTGLQLYLYCENKKGKIGYCTQPTLIQPTGKVTLNGEKDNDYFFAQLFNYMDKGKSALITGEHFLRERPKTYFRIDKRPESFEERLETILELEHELPLMYGRIKVPN